MRPVLLIDFGSTYTKLTAVDLDGEALLGTAAAYTTVQTDISDGLREGLARLEERTGKLDYLQTYACSSAAGGLQDAAAQGLLERHVLGLIIGGLRVGDIVQDRPLLRPLEVGRALEHHHGIGCEKI